MIIPRITVCEGSLTITLAADGVGLTDRLTRLKMPRPCPRACNNSVTAHELTRKPCYIARKPRDAVRFGLMFADIHYQFKSKLRKPGFRARSIHRPTSKKAEFNVKWSFKIMYFGVSGKAIRE